MSKHLTKSRTQDLINAFNNLAPTEVYSFILPEFYDSLTLCKGLTESMLIYKQVPFVTIKHSATPVRVTTQSEPYNSVFTYVLPLITRLLYAKVPLISGQLEIP